MKKLVIFSEESIFSGLVKCGIAEVVDSLGNSLSQQYDVNIICLDGKGSAGRAAATFQVIAEGVSKARFLQVNYYLIEKEYWPYKAIEIIDLIQPDIFHNFYEPDIITKVKNKPKRSVYTFDDISFLFGKEQLLEQYDFITTFSKGYAEEIMKYDNSVSKKLQDLKFIKISVGISDDLFTPQKGLFLPAPYDYNNQDNKEISKKRFLEKKGIQDNPCIFLVMCRLIKEKGIDQIIESIPFFKQNNSILVIIGTGDAIYEEELSKYTLEDGVLFIKNKAQIAQIPSLIAGADFYLQPSLMETGGLMPMTASLYGAIPIVSQNGGLSDNFNVNNAIIVNSKLTDSLNQAINLYNNSDLLKEKRKIAMSQDFSWKKRKKNFIDLYE